MKPKLNINESFICKIWEGGSSYYSVLQTTTGSDVEIISYGKRNYDSGPDYKNAKIKIDGKTLTGDVEIHRDFKNWEEHKHSKDRRYNPVILHVVLWDSEEHQEPKLRIKRQLPTVILSSFLKYSIHNIWQEIINKPSDKFRLPCVNLAGSIPDDSMKNWFSALADERLEIKAGRLKERLNELCSISGSTVNEKHVWQQLLYEFTFEALGFSKNKEQMLKIASSLTLEKIKKLRMKDDSKVCLEAALFGSAGFLFDVRLKDSYIDSVKSCWNKLTAEGLVPVLNRHEWNFFRMRPQNFPTVRIAYGGSVILKLINEKFIEKLAGSFSAEGFDVNDCCRNLISLLKPHVNSYWETHYDFGKLSASPNKLIGRQRMEDIIVNVFISFIVLYAREFKIREIETNALSLYRGMKVKPDNSVVNLVQDQLVKTRDIEKNTPAYEQAAIQLYNFYCMRERCPECVIGKSVFSDKGYEYKIIFY